MTRRDRYLQRKYGITEADYEALSRLGNGQCWICGKTPKGRKLHVEHDHKTGLIRGLACWPCNRGLQQFSDDPARLRAAAEYLEDHAALHAGGGAFGSWVEYAHAVLAEREKGYDV